MGRASRRRAVADTVAVIAALVVADALGSVVASWTTLSTLSTTTVTTSGRTDIPSSRDSTLQDTRLPLQDIRLLSRHTRLQLQRIKLRHRHTRLPPRRIKLLPRLIRLLHQHTRLPPLLTSSLLNTRHPSRFTTRLSS